MWGKDYIMKFEINGKEYNSVPLDFNAVCDIEDMGISMEDYGKKNTGLMRAYFALCSGLSLKQAGNEISTHIINGGSLDGFSEVFSKEADNSDFFQALTKNTKENAQQTEDQQMNTEV